MCIIHKCPFWLDLSLWPCWVPWFPHQGGTHIHCCHFNVLFYLPHFHLLFHSDFGRFPNSPPGNAHHPFWLWSLHPWLWPWQVLWFTPRWYAAFTTALPPRKPWSDATQTWPLWMPDLPLASIPQRSVYMARSFMVWWYLWGRGQGWGGASRKNLNSIEEPTFITGYGRHVFFFYNISLFLLEWFVSNR